MSLLTALQRNETVKEMNPVIFDALTVMYDEPHHVLSDYTLAYDHKIHILRSWRDERARYLLEYCRDMDYMFDDQLNAVLNALHKIRKDPRRYQ